jgi:hypothetical protein
MTVYGPWPAAARCNDRLLVERQLLALAAGGA